MACLLMIWSMKKERNRRAQTSASNRSPRMKAAPETALKIAKRLRIHLPPIVPKQGGGPKAKRGNDGKA